MAVGSVVAVVKGVSRHISWRVLMRPPVICFVWTAPTGVDAHSVGKKEETSLRASVVVRGIVVRFSLAAMIVDGRFCFSHHGGCNISLTFCQAAILLKSVRVMRLNSESFKLQGIHAKPRNLYCKQRTQRPDLRQDEPKMKDFSGIAMEESAVTHSVT